MKRIKMCLYGEPGVGKSVFASKSPNPFFICTDGNYEWLEDFGAKEEDHVNVTSWAEAKNYFKKDWKDTPYQTVVVDLTEDLFKWCEQEWCVKQKIEHVSDLGYGKGYDGTRNEFINECNRLISSDVNVIFIMHGQDVEVKDRRGVVHTKHVPSGRLPDKVLDMLEGKVRYFLRCYVKDDEQEDGTVIKNRYLSVVPKANEYGIIRGVNENLIQQDINLDWNLFVKTVGIETESIQKKETVKQKTPAKTKEKVETPSSEKEDNIIQVTIDDVPPFDVDEPEKVVEKTEKKTENVETTQSSQNEKINAIKAKLAALKAAKENK